MNNRVIAVLVGGAILAFGYGCGQEEDPAGEDQPLAFKLLPLDSACSQSGSAEQVRNWRVKVVRRAKTGLQELADESFGGGQSELALGGIPEGPTEVTVIATGASDKPIYYGRAKNVQVVKDQTAKIVLPVARYADYSCVKKEFNAGNLLFPTATQLPDGRVLFTGGFASAVAPEDGGDYQITTPQNKGYIFDPTTGTLREVEGRSTGGANAKDKFFQKSAPATNEMNHRRAAHAAIYLPTYEMVLIVGGIGGKEAKGPLMHKDKDGKTGDGVCFPWYFKKAEAGDAGYTYELFDTRREIFLRWDLTEKPTEKAESADCPEGYAPVGEDQKQCCPEHAHLTEGGLCSEWPDETHTLDQQVRRVFPGLSLNSDGTVLVTGGGTWPSCGTIAETDADYRVAELYRPRKESYAGGFMDTHGALTMKALRCGHTAVRLTVRDKLTYHLFWGGTQDDPIAELYHESSGQLDGNFGTFSPVTWIDEKDYKDYIYFHTITPLKDDQFLLIGGVASDNGQLKVPAANSAYLIEAMSDMKLKVKPLQGLGLGRYFHTTVTYDSDHAVVFGGFSLQTQNEDKLFGAGAVAETRFFDLTSEELSAPPLDAPAVPRGGLVSVPLAQECIVNFGGVDTVEAGLDYKGKGVGLFAEVYCPSSVCPETQWGNACYQQE
jgi:hypothetical protein